MFKVGDRFSSVEKLEEKIKLLRNDCYVDLWKRDSRTIAAAKKRVTKKSNLNLNLKYYEVFYSKLV